MRGIGAVFPSLRRAGGNAKSLIVAGSLGSFGGGLFTVARPVYLYAAGLDPTVIGILIAVESFLGVLLAIPVAMMSDLFGRKRFVVFGLLLDAVGAFLYFYSSDIIVLVIAQALFAFVTATVGAPFLALFADGTTEGNRNELFVLFYFAGGIATAIGSFVTGLQAPLAGLLGVGSLDAFRLLFLVVSATSLAAGVVVLRCVSERRAERAAAGGRGLSLRDMIRVPKKSMGVVKKFSIIGFTGFGAGLIIPLLPLWYNLRFGVDVSVIGPLFGSIFLTTALASLLTPAFAKRSGSVFTIVATQLSAIVLLVLIPLAPDYLSAGVVMVTRSTLANMSNPIMQSFMMGLIHPDERATASSMIQMFDAIPRAYAPAVGGYLLSVGLINTPFFVTAALYIVSTALFYIFFRKATPVLSRVDLAEERGLNSGSSG